MSNLSSFLNHVMLQVEGNFCLKVVVVIIIIIIIIIMMMMMMMMMMMIFTLWIYISIYN